MTGSFLERAQHTTFALTVTSGRSGTKLLAVLLRDALGLAAEHEPAPRVNFVMRSFVEAPCAAGTWLLTEKLPAMLDTARDGFYAETSHLFCKVLIEPMIQLGVHPKLIILTRPAREVASSLFRMNVVPARSESGRLVLLGPSDRGVLRLPDWTSFSDYQLCYWYALEIERRQAYYQQNARALGLSCMHVAMRGLLPTIRSASWRLFWAPSSPRRSSRGSPRSWPATRTPGRRRPARTQNGRCLTISFPRRGGGSRRDGGLSRLRHSNLITFAPLTG